MMLERNMPIWQVVMFAYLSKHGREYDHICRLSVEILAVMVQLLSTLHPYRKRKERVSGRS